MKLSQRPGFTSFCMASLVFLAGTAAPTASLANLPVSQIPLYISSAQDAPPLNMLVMGRDHKLYYEAYNDVSDLDGDGLVDVGYKPSIDYYGYFNSNVCYRYTGGTGGASSQAAAGGHFVPESAATNKQCSGLWSGDFLNYLATSRMDALRRVLYGGHRSVDNTSTTILEAAYIPRDAHSWGKSFDPTRDEYNISNYAPLTNPATGRRHIFAVTTLNTAGANTRSQLRVLSNTNWQIWDWVSRESSNGGQGNHSCGTTGMPASNGTTGRHDCVANGRGTITGYNIRVQACTGVAEALREDSCRAYPNSGNTIYKPSGLLHDFGEQDKMYFGLLTGSHQNNITGGVLRRNISSFAEEINLQTGVFRSEVEGIVTSINRLGMIDFNSSNYYSGCNWNSFYKANPIDHPSGNSADCAMWGNPIAEMMFEALRYYSGESDAHSLYDYGSTGKDVTHNLPKPGWTPPYEAKEDNGGGFLHCARPVMTVLSDINPSYDFKIPGSRYQSIAAEAAGLPGFNVSNETDAIGAAEGIHGGTYFIGQSNAGNANDAPSPKVVGSLSYARGLSPEEPSKRGTYYSAGVARYGARNNIAGNEKGKNPVMTYSVALASPLPEIRIPIPGTIDPVRYATIVPFAKSVRSNTNPAININNFTPTNPLVDYYIDVIANTGIGNEDPNINGGRPYAKFSINFEDMEVGSDHDMDTITDYTAWIRDDGMLQVDLDTTFKAGSTVQHMGYVITGTTKDGIYLEVDDTQNAGVFYDMNTPAGRDPGYCVGRNNAQDGCRGLPGSASREFTLSTSSSAGEFLRDPLWYAAKYGRPLNYDWDEDGDGEPDNYFLVTNAGTLKEQLERAFAQIIADTRSSGGTAASGSRHNDGFLAYVPEYDTRDWTGDIKAYRVNRGTGALIQPPVWSVAEELEDLGADARDIYFVRKTNPASPLDVGTLAEFTTGNLGGVTDAPAALGFPTVAAAGDIDEVVDYLRGDQSLEVSDPDDGTGRFRQRGSILGDILGSQPTILGTGSYGYSLLPEDEGGGFDEDGLVVDGGYVKFVEWKKTRTPVAFVGANDGMLHAIDASQGANGGKELFAIIPNSVLGNLHELTSPTYQHRYYVDGSPEQGDAYLEDSWKTVILAPMGAGGRSIVALDATNPAVDGAQLLWEFSHPDLGLTIGRPRITRWNGQWVAIFGNGYNAAGGGSADDQHKAFLFIVDLTSGSLLQKIKLGDQGTADIPNGLATTFPVDLNNDADADLVYAGDYYGNLWRISLKEYGDTSALDAVRLYEGELQTVGTGANAVHVPVHPITGGVNATYHPARGQMVLFGTGKYFLEGDNAAFSSGDPVNSFFGIWDDPLAASLSGYPLDKNDLQQQSFGAGPVTGTRTVTGGPVDWNGVDGPRQFGWYINLPDPGERFVGIPEISLGRVIFTTFVAEGDECAPGGYNWLNVLSAISGIGMIQQGGGGGAGLSSIALPTDGGGGPAPTPPTVTVPPEQACDPSEDDCDPPELLPECDPTTDPDCTPECDPDTGQCSTQDFGARGCQTRVGVLTHLGIIDFDTFSCGRQSWKQYE